MWQVKKFTPSWSKSQWVRWATNKWPNESIKRFKDMKVNQIIAMYHNC